jgi:hypothetical protein
VRLREARALVRALLEARLTVRDLPDHIAVKVVKHTDRAFEVTFWDREDGRNSQDPKAMMIITRDRDKDGPSGGAWSVGWSEATRGWGPMLYDVTMEVASILGGGLMSDRRVVSPQAHRVWLYYRRHRRDVEHHQLDDLAGTLTRDPSDNSLQKSAKHMAGDHWRDAPESKRYTKRPTTLRALKLAGKLLVGPGVPPLA